MTIHIELDKPHSYSSGEVVSGHVLIGNIRRKVKKLKVKLVGRERINANLSEPIVADFIQEGAILLGHVNVNTTTLVNGAGVTPSHQIASTADDGNNHTTTINPEESFQSYPFIFQLPGNLPSSFKSDKCEIYYYLEAELRLSLFIKNERTKLPFNVNGILDLNLEFNALLDSDQANFASRSGNETVSLQLPRKSSFVPGEILEFHAFIDNSRSSTYINGVVACILQVVNLKPGGKHGMRSESIKIIVNSVRGPTLGIGETLVWKPTNLFIPDVQPTGFGRRRSSISSGGGSPPLIDLKYVLHLEIDIAGSNSKPLVVGLPIVIGTIPLRPPTLPRFVPREITHRAQEEFLLEAPLSVPETDFESDGADLPNFAPAPLPIAPLPEDLPTAPVLTVDADDTIERDLSGPEELSGSPPRYEDVAECFLSGSPDLFPPSYSEAVTLE